jgi:hypothetical protein
MRGSELLVVVDYVINRAALPGPVDIQPRPSADWHGVHPANFVPGTPDPGDRIGSRTVRVV